MTKRKSKPEDDLSRIVPADLSQVARPDDDESPAAKRIRELEKQLAEANAGRSTAEQKLIDQALAQGSLLQTSIEEIPTGKFVTVPGCTGYKTVSYKDDGRPILRPNFEDKKLPTFFYKIDLPPSGGDKIRINGAEWYHGAVVEVDQDLLRTMKDIVYRCWKHDQDIHGSNENAYRRQKRPHLSARGM